MKQRFTYEIEVSDRADWRSVTQREEVFSREAHEVARALLEGWIIDHPRRLTGGERIVVPTPRHPLELDSITPTLRVKVFRGSRDDHKPEPDAIGYLGYDSEDYNETPFDRTRARVGEIRERARQTVHAHRVGTGVVATASVVAGVIATRLLRGRKRGRS